MMCTHTGSYFRKHIKHIGEGGGHAGSMGRSGGSGILVTLCVKSVEFFTKSHRICGKFTTEKDSLAKSAEIWGSLAHTPTRKTCLHTYI